MNHGGQRGLASSASSTLLLLYLHLLFSLYDCANLFCVLLPNGCRSAAPATESALLVLPVPVTGYIFEILLPLPPLHRHALSKLTEQITNFVIFSFISFHFIRFTFAFPSLPKGHFLKQPNI